MGFGHRVYKNYDPRARIIKQIAYEVFEVTGKNPLLDIALELERIALADEYFIKRKLYPNVDFYSGSSTRRWASRWRCSRCCSPSPRTVGWVAQWEEMLLDPEQKIARPRQIYTGYQRRATTSTSPPAPRRRGSGRCPGAGVEADFLADFGVGQHRRCPLGARKIRSTSSSVAAMPRFSSQKVTFERPDIGPISISCSRPTRLAGIAE